MKKSLTLVLALLSACVITSPIFAGPLGGLGKSLLGSDEAKPATGTLPADVELLPVVWNLLYSTPAEGDKTIRQIKKFDKLDVINNEYEFTQVLIYKFGLGLQGQESKLKITGNGNSVTVETLDMRTYNVDKEGKKITSKNSVKTSEQNPKSSWSKNSANIVKELEERANALKKGGYDEWLEKATYNLTVYTAVGRFSANRLKAKKWYGEHPIEGKKVEKVPFYVSNIDESKKAGYAYMLGGMSVLNKAEDTPLVTVYSNNDAYIDLKDDQFIEISGTVEKVNFSNDYDKDYKVTSIVITE
ncbi:MAG: hypothetical protein IJ158_09605 [Treponema sp.]|nr:hypothetical protein [Treponema sp.]